jgi:hypothetical protein
MYSIFKRSTAITFKIIYYMYFWQIGIEWAALVSKSSTSASSFIPSTVLLWNILDISIRNSPTLPSFKNRVKADIYQTPKYYNEGPHKLSILHTGLRHQCSSKYFGVDVITILIVPKEQSFNIDIDIFAITQKCSSFVQV